ncbi:LysR family transcriptional regulator [Amycolatopsis mediterranei S699]|uniref:LysR family transcriptional regulator n=1 Tax=Amycolatopsis mediterranei (strain S699) TaxID=713604 RepID=A0A9R0P1G2_AMYMS|nr:LysR family transcriptional regulator [Amycolatopsis mediterranei S699]
MLDAHRLAVLAEVAHAGSIAAAAQRLSFTPSAVLQQLAKLERDVGARLLDRHARGVTLTPVGEALLGHAEAIVGELRTAERTVRAARRGAHRRHVRERGHGPGARRARRLPPRPPRRGAAAAGPGAAGRVRPGQLPRARPADHPPLPRRTPARPAWPVAVVAAFGAVPADPAEGAHEGAPAASPCGRWPRRTGSPAAPGVPGRAFGEQADARGQPEFEVAVRRRLPLSLHPRTKCHTDEAFNCYADVTDQRREAGVITSSAAGAGDLPGPPPASGLAGDRDGGAAQPVIRPVVRPAVSNRADAARSASRQARTAPRSSSPARQTA